MSDSKTQNLRAIQAALDLHSEHCLRPALAIAMSPFEVERLGWDEFDGLPIVPDSDMATGRVRIICQDEDSGDILAGLELIYDDEPLPGEEVEDVQMPQNAIRRMLDHYGK